MNDTEGGEEKRVAELTEKLRELYRRDQFGIHDEILKFFERLKRRHRDFRSYRLVHLLSGSTIQPPYAHFDFEGDDSVEAFINSQYEKISGDRGE